MSMFPLWLCRLSGSQLTLLIFVISSFKRCIAYDKSCRYCAPRTFYFGGNFWKYMVGTSWSNLIVAFLHQDCSWSAQYLHLPPVHPSPPWPAFQKIVVAWEYSSSNFFSKKKFCFERIGRNDPVTWFRIEENFWIEVQCKAGFHQIPYSTHSLQLQ